MGAKLAIGKTKSVGRGPVSVNLACAREASARNWNTKIESARPARDLLSLARSTRLLYYSTQLQCQINLTSPSPRKLLPAGLYTRSTRLLMTRKTRRRNKSRGADLEAQPGDNSEGLRYYLPCALRSPLLQRGWTCNE